jgi:hypothetical protein
MSQKTIQCRLVASASDRQQLWHLMANKNTPLINALFADIAQHPNFSTWTQQRRLPTGTIKQLCQPYRQNPEFADQPGRFFSSAIALVEYVYKSWFAIQKRLQQRIDGQTRWLQMLQSDSELSITCQQNLDTIRTTATRLLAPLQPAATPKATSTKKQSKSSTKTISNHLFRAYNTTTDTLTQCAIVYLLKNGCQIPTEPEDPKKLEERRKLAETRITRLQKQLQTRIPKGRDLTGDTWLNTLIKATESIPTSNDQFMDWQAQLLRQSKNIPFPISYDSNTDMTWFRNPQGRLCVRFNGLSKYISKDYIFQIYCDRRQLHWFERFLEDQTQAQTSPISTSLFTLRAAKLMWQSQPGKGDPWEVNHLKLSCCVDTDLWTAAGTQQVQTRKAEKAQQEVDRINEKTELKPEQTANLKRKHTLLQKITQPIPRPTTPPYQGRPNILVGISLGLQHPATAAVIDTTTGQVLTYRSTRQLLGKNYNLLNRQRKQQHENAHQRHVNQRLSRNIQPQESELGKYVDRLLASAIVDLAKTHQASSIVLPSLTNVRERTQSEIQAKAEKACPDLIVGQKKYAKKQRTQIHRWSYGRLSESIAAQANQNNIAIEQGYQPSQGTPQEIAKDLAFSAYETRRLTS